MSFEYYRANYNSQKERKENIFISKVWLFCSVLGNIFYLVCAKWKAVLDSICQKQKKESWTLTEDILTFY